MAFISVTKWRKLGNGLISFERVTVQLPSTNNSAALLPTAQLSLSLSSSASSSAATTVVKERLDG